MPAPVMPAPAMPAPRPPRLLVAVSGHGYGHAAQAAPVVQTLRAWAPEVEIVVRSLLAPAKLREFFPGARIAPPPIGDFGMIARSAFSVDRGGSMTLYADLHRDLPARIAEEAAALAAVAPDAVLADVPYLTVAAAARAGVPSVAMSSLTWAHVYGAYADRRIERWRVFEEILACCRAASVFLACAPAMPMPGLEARPIGPVARVVTPNRFDLARRLRLGRLERVVLVTLGGVPAELPLAAWPMLSGVRLVIAGADVPERPDMTPLDALDMSHLDVLASVDAVVTKPGYATFVEAACHAVPVLYAPRADWPEEPALTAWIEANAVAERIDRAQLALGNLADALNRLWARPRRIPVIPTGNAAAATLVAKALQAGLARRRPAG